MSYQYPYQWSLSAANGVRILGGAQGPGVAIRFSAPINEAQFQLNLTLTNACGVHTDYWTISGEQYFPACQPWNAGRAAYANPADGELTVQPLGVALTLYNAHGKPVLRQATPGS